jgi:hypothetical protein
MQAERDPALTSLQSRADFRALLDRLRQQDEHMRAGLSSPE